MVISVTGHRPNKLFGYDLTNYSYIKMRNYFKKFLIEYKCTEAITGMALGVDTVFAQAVLDLKQQGYDIKLHCSIPCLDHSCRWTEVSKVMYNSILNKADIVKIVSEVEYNNSVMQKRNIYMVDRSDIVLGVWDGTNGGTANCIKYANKVSSSVIVVSPTIFK